MTDLIAQPTTPLIQKPKRPGRPRTVPEELRRHLYLTAVNIMAKGFAATGKKLPLTKALKRVVASGGLAEVVGGSTFVSEPDEQANIDSLANERGLVRSAFFPTSNSVDGSPSQGNEYPELRLATAEKAPKNGYVTFFVSYRAPSLSAMRNMYIKERKLLFPSARARLINEAYQRAGLPAPNAASADQYDSGLVEVEGD
jgi:hypothetical protein